MSAAPGLSSWMLAWSSTWKAAAMTPRSEATTMKSSLAQWKQGRMPCRSRMANASPVPSMPTMAKPPSQSFAASANTPARSRFSSTNSVHFRGTWPWDEKDT